MFSGSIQKYCLVTVGATVGFEQLTKQVLQPDFWNHLRSVGFTDLRIQCGPDVAWASKELEAHKCSLPEGLQVGVFEMSKNLMREEMTLCKASEGQRALGLVISHAGK